MSLHNQNVLGASISTEELEALAVTLAKMAADSVDSGKILDDSIVNADIKSNAAIAYSKLNLALSILNADIATNAAIALSKLDKTGMTTSKVLGYDGTNIAPVNQTGAWNVVGRADLSGGAADTIEITGINPTYDEYLVIAYLDGSGSVGPAFRINNLSTGIYSTNSKGTRTDNSQSGATYALLSESKSNVGEKVVIFIYGATTKKKVGNFHISGDDGGYMVGSISVNETSNPISRITIVNLGTGDFGTATEILVLGRNI